MELQHTVTFPDGVTLTRLPIGRAAGCLWVSFVATGIPDGDEWDIESHVGLVDATALSGGGCFGEGMEQMQFQYLDPGGDSVEVTYRNRAGNVIDSETVALEARR